MMIVDNMAIGYWECYQCQESDKNTTTAKYNGESLIYQLSSSLEPIAKAYLKKVKRIWGLKFPRFSIYRSLNRGARVTDT